MSEHIERPGLPAKAETDPNLAKYEEMMRAMDEEELLLQEMDDFLRSAANRAEAEEVACEKFVPRINEARRRASAAWKEWADLLKKL
jgi:hypothetical protein